MRQIIDSGLGGRSSLSPQSKRNYGKRQTKVCRTVAILLMCLAVPCVLAQDRYALERARAAVREQILRDRGGNAIISFPEYLQNETYLVSNTQTGVRGQGVYARNNYSPQQTFSYEAVVNIRNGRVDRVSYRFTDDEGGGSVPSWLVGTFRGRDPITRQRVTVTIHQSGEAFALYENGQQQTGRVYGDTIRFGSVQVWDVSAAGSGFRARSERRTENFDRVSDGGGGGGSDPCAVPRWTVGRFRGTTNTGESELTINADGSATARSLTANRTFSGRYSDGILRFDFGSFSIARDGDGIRTIEVGNTRNQTTYTRARY